MSCISKDYLYISLERNKIALSRCCYINTHILLDPDEFFKLSLKDLSKLNYISKPDMFCGEDNCEFGNIKNVVVSISKACNFHCEKCPIPVHSDSSYEKDLYFKVLNHLKNFELNSIELTRSGEPFYYFDDIINYLKTLDNKNVKQVLFTTNGSLLSRKKIIDLYTIQNETNIKYIITVSVDGINRKHYKKIRHFSFNKIIKTVKILKKYFETRISYTYKKSNDIDIFSILTFFNKLGIQSRNINIGVDTYYNSYSKDEEKEIIKKYKDIQRVCYFF